MIWMLILFLAAPDSAVPLLPMLLSRLRPADFAHDPPERAEALSEVP
jgi:hypothetical protein